MEIELYKQNSWWEEEFVEESYEREIYLNQIKKNLQEPEIIFLTGLRRIGKTTIMKQTIKELLENNVKPQDILFVNLDSFNFIDKSIHEIVEKYKEIHKKPSKDFFYLFLDEITSKENFEQELKSLYDNENIKIIASSSIATLMRDKKAYLTGRTRTIEVMPLTFDEFLIFKEVKLKKSDRAALEGYFKDYLRVGGIPNYVLKEDKEYLNELVQSIIYKDIIAHYNITNEKIIKELFVLLCKRVGKVTSYNKLSNILKISPDSVKRYIDYFEKSFLFYSIGKYSKSYNETVTAPKKIYIGDVGIKNLITGFKDLGASYENLVFLKIKNSNPTYYIKDLIEIDFIMQDQIIEAKYNSELNDKQREVFDNFKIKEKTIANGLNFFI